MARAGSVGSGRVISGVAAGTSSAPWVLGTSLDLALDHESFGSLDPVEFGFVLSVVEVLKPCRMLTDNRSGNSAKSRTLFKKMRLLQTNWFRAVKRDRISPRLSPSWRNYPYRCGLA